MAEFADKLRLTLAVGFFTVTARRASAAGVARVNRNNPHARNGRFIFQKVSQLSESPVGMLGSLRFLNRRPLTNTFEFFKGYRSNRVFSLRDKLFRNAMVHIALIAALLAAQFLEPALGRACANRLQDAATFLIPLAFALNCCAGVTLTVAIGCNVGDAEVNTKRVFNFFRRRLKHFADGEQKEITFVIYKVRLALSRCKQLFLSLAADVRNALATIHSPAVSRFQYSKNFHYGNPQINEKGGDRSL